MISIFDYGAGNLQSVQNTLGAIGAEYELIRDADGLRRATKIVLPGVGHFGQMMRALDELKVREALLERIRAGVPFLGICLGLQALFAASDEAPEIAGLGLYPERVRKFSNQARVPHMGWNQLDKRKTSEMLNGAGERPYVYFAHSYYAPVVSQASAICDYTVPYTAVLEHENVRGVQFHPEKSGAVGMRIVRNFIES